MYSTYRKIDKLVVLQQQQATIGNRKFQNYAIDKQQMFISTITA